MSAKVFQPGQAVRVGTRYEGRRVTEWSEGTYVLGLGHGWHRVRVGGQDGVVPSRRVREARP